MTKVQLKFNNIQRFYVLIEINNRNDLQSKETALSMLYVFTRHCFCSLLWKECTHNSSRVHLCYSVQIKVIKCCLCSMCVCASGFVQVEPWRHRLDYCIIGIFSIFLLQKTVSALFILNKAVLFCLNAVKCHLSSPLPCDSPQLIHGCRNPAGFSFYSSDRLPQTRCFPLRHPAGTRHRES